MKHIIRLIDIFLSLMKFLSTIIFHVHRLQSTSKVSPIVNPVNVLCKNMRNSMLTFLYFNMVHAIWTSELVANYFFLFRWQDFYPPFLKNTFIDLLNKAN